MTIRARHSLLAVAALLALAMPPTADAAPAWQKILQDCVDDGDLDREYSRKDLKKAKKKMPSDANEYGDCAEVIEAALTAPAGGGPGGGGGLTPQEQAARKADAEELASVIRDRPKPKVDVGGKKVEPDDSGLFDIAGSSNGLPPPLMAALIAIALIAMGGGSYALRRRIPALARIPLPRFSLSRVPIPRFRR